jgi:opacity protein-like surface antigen
VLALSAGVTIAQTVPPASNWQYEFTPYLWAAGMKGDVQGGSLPKITTDVSFSDISKVLDFGLMGAFEARKGQWGLLFDAIYMDLSVGGAASRTGPGPIGASATANANVGMKQTVLAAAVAYRIVESRSPVDMIGGLRYVKLDVDADIHGSFFAQAGSVVRSGSGDWVDPYVGARVRYALNDRWSLTGYGDIGGFGLGSDITWQVSAGATYDFSKSVSGVFGYRIFYADYDKSGFLYDMKSEGLYAGASIRF